MLQPDGRMRIVIATHHYPPTYLAGVELLTQRLARWMAQRGHQVEVVCVEEIDALEPLMVRTELEDGVQIHRLGLQLTGQPDPLAVRHRDDALRNWFADYLRRVEPHVFHSQSSYVISASLIDAAKLVGVPVVASLHDYWYLCPRITLLRSDGSRCDAQVTAADCARCLMRDRARGRLLERVHLAIRHPDLEARLVERQNHLDSVLRSVDQILTPALLTYELLLARGYDPSRVRLVRQGLRAPPARVPIATTHRDGLRVGYLGQFVHHKGVHVLVEAFGYLSAGRGVSLVLFGDETRFPSYSKRLRRMANQMRGVDFAGVFRNDEVWSVLNQMDVLVVPSLWYEISPLVILEAFAAGVPVIASDLRNMNYQVRNEMDGLLFKAGDALDLSRQLQRLMDDPHLLPTLRRGIQPVHKLDDELREIESIYGELAARDRNALPAVNV
jgi:glycosyltransferase involved in cell wall biosynthesis